MRILPSAMADLDVWQQAACFEIFFRFLDDQADLIHVEKQKAVAYFRRQKDYLHPNLRLSCRYSDLKKGLGLIRISIIGEILVQIRN